MTPDDYIRMEDAIDRYGINGMVLAREMLNGRLEYYVDIDNEVWYVHEETIKDFMKRVDI